MEALLKLGSSNSQAAENRSLNDLSQYNKKLPDKIEMGTSFMMPNGEVSFKKKLSDGFVNSILKYAKPGLKTEA
jgi:hypothetical protein